MQKKTATKTTTTRIRYLAEITFLSSKLAQETQKKRLTQRIRMAAAAT